jgi:hypothetical protein
MTVHRSDISNFKTGESIVPTMALGHNNMTGFDPDVVTMRFKLTDHVRIVSGSDGFWGMIVKSLDEDKLKTFTLEQLIELAENRWRQEWEYAGDINKPDNMTAVEFTKQNFDYCNQMILKSEAGELLEPLTYITNTLANATNDTKDSIQNVRAMFNKTRGNVQTFSTDMVGSVINDITPLYT